MYIKQIIIQGFKSYKDQTVIEPFSDGLNVIVGKNGSGKSNFFAAIRFVLGDAYTQMGREERQALLHEGSGSAVMSAYVEVIFDNSDERFPTGKPELILRRTIGLKKDEYSLDRKNATKSDVNNLLEAAGFSKSNPYYIVPQGRVTTLTNMKDPERLSLLKEVAGTHSYDRKRAESLKLVETGENTIKKIDESLSNIEARLEELEEEKEELRQYQEKEREHRCLQYTLLHREQQEYQRVLYTIDEQRNIGVDETDSNRQAMDQYDQEMEALESQLIETRQKLDFTQVEKQQLDEDRREAQREKAKVELELQNLTAGQSAAQNAKAKHDQELQQVQQMIKEKEQELAKILPNFTSTRDRESATRSQLEGAIATRKRLFDKQARSGLYKSKKERDDHLKAQVNEISVQMASRKAVLVQTDEELGQIQTDIAGVTASIQNARDQLENRDDHIHTTASESEKAREVLEQLQDRRKELWREEQQVQSFIEKARKNLEETEKPLRSMTDRNTWQGIKSVRRIKEEHGLDGVYGTLGELFDVSEVYRSAVEVTAGQSLFHYIVDNDDTATTVMEILQKQKGGRVTFMPLNRLRPKAINMPKVSDAVPMLSKIRYDPIYEKAFQQVFGKTVICPSLAVASQYARSHGVSAITPGGDRSDKKGALTGGYYDTTKSRIQAIRRTTKCQEELDAQQEKLEEIRKELTKLEQQITSAVSDMQKIDKRRMQLDSSYGPLRNEIRALGLALQQKRDALEEKKLYKEKVNAAQHDSSQEQQAYETEMNSDFKQSLSSQEQSQLERLGPMIQQLQKQLNDISVARSDLESRKNILDVELRENLRLRLDQLNAQEIEGSSGRGVAANVSSQLKDKQRALKRVEKILSDVQKKFEDAQMELEQTTQTIAALQARKIEKQQNQEELKRSIERHQKRMEKSMQKKALITEKLAEVNRDIRDLGVLPEEAFKKYDKWDSEKAMKRIQQVKESLKKYSHVNKKAFEQYNSFFRERKALRSRLDELVSSNKAIQILIENLDQQKDEAIERTFKQVSKEFATVFERLVPAGKGRLIIQRKTDRQVRQDLEDESDNEPRDSIESYTGVGISVSFNSKHDEQQRIQQLSGGQKSKLRSIATSTIPLTIPKVYVPSHSFLPFNGAIQHPSTYSTKSTQISMPSTAQLLPRCLRRCLRQPRVVDNSFARRSALKWCWSQRNVMVSRIPIRRVALMWWIGKRRWTLWMVLLLASNEMSLMCQPLTLGSWVDELCMISNFVS
jgi:structural maintenance of chromosome 3 (chondroitin sulfate proteoglycan 6)